MIRIFFNGDGYFVSGEGVEVSRRCSPAITERGDLIFQPIHHQYKILYLALTELRHLSLKEDVIVYNDSRIIDEVNGHVQPLDISSQEWLNVIRRHAIPGIKSVVFFRKKSDRDVTSAINDTLEKTNDRYRQQLMEKEIKTRVLTANKNKQTILQHFKRSWLGE